MDVLHLVATRYLAAVAQIVRQGLVHGYTEVEANLPVLRGRLRLADHLRDNATDQARFAVAFDAWDMRHPINLILAAALDRLRVEYTSPTLAARAAELQSAFPPAPPPRQVPALLGRVRLDRRTRRCAAALRLAALILSRQGPTADYGRRRTPSLLFDMNRLFEGYVARLAQGIAGLRVTTQETRRFWHADGSAGSGSRWLRPDLLVRRAGVEAPVVIDTKWKALDGRLPSGEDVRQMFAYLHVFGGRRGVLLYPAGREEGRSAWGQYAAGDQVCGAAQLRLLPGGIPDRRAIQAQLGAILDGAAAGSLAERA